MYASCKCINCDALLSEVYEKSSGSHSFQDALDIQVYLGFGEFRDHSTDSSAARRANFCYICATKLIMEFPGFRKMVGDQP